MTAPIIVHQVFVHVPGMAEKHLPARLDHRWYGTLRHVAGGRATSGSRHGSRPLQYDRLADLKAVARTIASRVRCNRDAAFGRSVKRQFRQAAKNGRTCVVYRKTAFFFLFPDLAPRRS